MALVRGSVTGSSPTVKGGPAEVLVDGADTPVEANGLTGYTPSAGDRLLLDRVGNQLEILQFLSVGIVPGSGSKTFRQDTEPTAAESSDGDLWFDTDSNDTPYRYDGTQWLPVAQPGFIMNGTISFGESTISPTTGITIPGPDGAVTNFPADGSPAKIAAFVTAQGMALEEGAYLYGVSQVSGELQIGAGVKNPTIAPKIVRSHPVFYFPTYEDQMRRDVGFMVGTSFPFYGLTLDRSNDAGGLEPRLATSGTDGSIVFFDRHTLRRHRWFNVFDDPEGGNKDYNAGIARDNAGIGGRYFVLASPRTGGAGLTTGEWLVRIYNADYFEVGYDDDFPGDRYYEPGDEVPYDDTWSLLAPGTIASHARPAIGISPTDDTVLWLAYVPVGTNDLVIEEWDIATQTLTATHNHPGVGEFTDASVDAIFLDIETNEVFVSIVESTIVKCFDLFTWVRQPTLDFFKHVPAGGATPEPVGFYSTWNGAGYILVGVMADRLVSYDGPTTSSSGTIRYTWWDSIGGYETAPSPTLAATTQRRATTLVVCAPPPHRGVVDPTITNKANRIRLYVLDGGDYDLLDNLPTDEVQQAISGFTPIDSSTHPPVTNEFDALGIPPGFIDSAASDGFGPLINLSGDGSARIGELTTGTGGALNGDAARLGKVAKATSSDWNNATLNGWWIGTNLTNGPLATGKFLVQVIAESTTNLIQIATQLTTGATSRWRRDRVAGTWGSWQRDGMYNTHWRTTDVSVANNTWSAVPFPTGANDPEFPGTTTFTIPFTGRYSIVGQVAFRGNATGRRSVRLDHNAGTIILESEPNVTSAGTGPHCLPFSGVFDLTAGDTIEVQAFQTSGAALNIAGTRSYTFVNIDRIR